MADADYARELRELRDVVEHDHADVARLEGEVIGIGSELRALANDVRGLSGRLNTFANAIINKLDRLSEHLGVPFKE